MSLMGKGGRLVRLGGLDMIQQGIGEGLTQSGRGKDSMGKSGNKLSLPVLTRDNGRVSSLRG